MDANDLTPCSKRVGKQHGKQYLVESNSSRYRRFLCVNGMPRLVIRSAAEQAAASLRESLTKK
jgi:hypothetical protein